MIISPSAISPYKIPSFQSVGVGFLGLLDEYPNAAAAYSVRLLKSDYTGALVEIAGYTTTPTFVENKAFLPDANNELSLTSQDVGLTTTLGDWITANNITDGYVRTWYDQSGAGSDATQTTASNQPKIVSSGAVITENGKISVKFNGTTDYIQNQLSVGGTVTAFAVSKIVSELDFNFIYDSFGTGGRIRLGLHNANEYFVDNGDAKYAYSTTASNGLQNLFFAEHTNSRVSISVNQDTLQAVQSANFYANTQYWNIGARNDGAEHFLDGTIQELILYPSDQSTNREAIETNINNHYTIY